MYTTFFVPAGKHCSTPFNCPLLLKDMVLVVDVGPIALFSMKTFSYPTRVTTALFAAAIAPPLSCEVVEMKIEMK